VHNQNQNIGLSVNPVRCENGQTLNATFEPLSNPSSRASIQALNQKPEKTTNETPAPPFSPITPASTQTLAQTLESPFNPTRRATTQRSPTQVYLRNIPPESDEDSDLPILSDADTPRHAQKLSKFPPLTMCSSSQRNVETPVPPSSPLLRNPSIEPYGHTNTLLVNNRKELATALKNLCVPPSSVVFVRCHSLEFETLSPEAPVDELC
jgi:hypothetical protein